MKRGWCDEGKYVQVLGAEEKKPNRRIEHGTRRRELEDARHVMWMCALRFASIP